MAELNLTELRKVAEAATPGPWEVEGQGPGPDSRNMGCGVVYTMGEGVEGGDIAEPAGDCYPRSGYSPREDMTHIATFDPPTVLALLDRIAELEDRLQAQEAEMGTLLGVERAKVARAEAFSRELRGYCSPHGVAATYADRLDGALDGRDPIERLHEKLTGGESDE